MMMNKAWILALGLFATGAQAADGLVINAAEVGIGKFHRMDNQVHTYGTNNAWSVFILPDGAELAQAPIVAPQKNGSYTIFFSNLKELLSKMVEISNQTGQKISVFNMNAHGMPGGMWFPKDASERDGLGCSQWVTAAKGADQANYDQYYSPVSASEIEQVRLVAKLPFPIPNPCTATVGTWKSQVAAVKGIREAFAPDAQIHFLSCTVGLGSVGDKFTKGIAALLLNSSAGRVESAFKFGLGDWSMPEGMGFWDMESLEQLKRDNANYPKDRQDREQMQKGVMRVASIDGSHSAISGQTGERDFMVLDMSSSSDEVRPTFSYEVNPSEFTLPKSVRIPHTNVVFKLTN
jgi:hypothetical protein